MSTEKAVTELRPTGEAHFRPLKFQPAWVETRNEREFLAMMEIVDAAAGYGRFAYLWDLAGRGKTETSARYAASHALPFLRVRDDWRGSTLPFLRVLCRELGMETQPASRSRCIDQVIERLLARSARARVVFLDEMDRIPKHLDLMRDLADLSGAALILIGETSMPAIMEANRRSWSRTLGAVRFEAAEPQALMAYAWEAAGLRLEPSAALLLNQAVGGGDWRIIRNRTVKLVALANTERSNLITEARARLVLEGGR